jgi:hypothetical protein
VCPALLILLQVKLLRLFMRPLSSSLLPDPSAYRFWTEHFGLKVLSMSRSFSLFFFFFFPAFSLLLYDCSKADVRYLTRV